MLALDTPSPDPGAAIGRLGDDSPGHKLLLKQKVVIVEYLANTDGLEAGAGYEIAALPLKLRGCDGSPARDHQEEREKWIKRILHSGL